MAKIIKVNASNFDLFRKTAFRAAKIADEKGETLVGGRTYSDTLRNLLASIEPAAKPGSRNHVKSLATLEDARTYEDASDEDLAVLVASVLLDHCEVNDRRTKWLIEAWQKLLKEDDEAAAQRSREETAEKEKEKAKSTSTQAKGSKAKKGGAAA